MIKRIAAIVFVIFASPAAFAQSSVSHVATEAALAATATTSYPNGLWRDQYSSGIGSPLFYQPSASACSLNSGNGDGGSQVSSSDSKCWLAVFPSTEYDPTDWGADPTGTSNAVSAIQSALAAALATHSTIKFRCGNYLVSSSGSEVMNISSGPFALLGAGKCVNFTGTLSSSTDLVRIAPSASARGFDIGNFTVSTSGGQHIIDLDATAGNTVSIFEAKLHDIMALNATQTGAGIFANTTNSGGSTPCGGTNCNGSLVNSDIYENVFNAATQFSTTGIKLQYAGDSIRIRDNVLTGPGYGIYEWGCHPNGCAGTVIERNNITAASASIRIDGGIRPIIQNNELELSTGSGTGAMLDIAGSDQPVAIPLILNNTIHCAGCSGLSEAIQIAGGTNPTAGAIIDANDIGSSQSGVIGINIALGATGTRVAPNNSYTSLTANVQDSGSGSQIGLTCSGAPSTSFASSNGMVTHC